MTLQQALEIFVVFASASLQSFGGGNTVIPQIQLDAVHTYGWLTDRQFAEAFALAQAAPGPSTLVVSAIGYQAAGWAGAVLATVAMIAPAFLLMYVVSAIWARLGHSRLREAIETGLAPISIGLILSSAIVIARSTEHSLLQIAMTAGVTLFLCATRFNPLWAMASCGLLGWLVAI